MNNEQINNLHPDRETALEIAVDTLTAALSDTRAVLISANKLRVASPSGVGFKVNCRAVVDRTTDTALLEQHPNIG